MTSPGESSNSGKLWDSTFDIIKGALVVWMIVRHTTIIASTADDGYFARYINFLSGSFIFITGYMIGRFAQRKFDREPAASSRRLVSRGVKLLLIFSALNLAIQASGFGNAGKEQFALSGLASRLGDIYAGNPDVVSFLILLPIGYLLLIAPLLLSAGSGGGRRGPAAVLAASLLAGTLAFLPQSSLTLKFLLTGIIAVSIGQLSAPPRPRTSPATRHLIAVALLAAGTWIAGPLGINMTIYAVGVGLVILALYLAAGTMNAGGRTGATLALLGRYSLVGYILQVLMIQVLLRVTGGERLPPGPELVAIAIATFVVVLAACWMLDRVRSRSRGVDGAYRFVFS